MLACSPCSFLGAVKIVSTFVHHSFLISMKMASLYILCSCCRSSRWSWQLDRTQCGPCCIFSAANGECQKGGNRHCHLPRCCHAGAGKSPRRDPGTGVAFDLTSSHYPSALWIYCVLHSIEHKPLGHMILFDVACQIRFDQICCEQTSLQTCCLMHIPGFSPSDNCLTPLTIIHLL